MQHYYMNAKHCGQAVQPYTVCACLCVNRYLVFGDIAVTSENFPAVRLGGLAALTQLHTLTGIPTLLTASLMLPACIMGSRLHIGPENTLDHFKPNRTY